MGKWNKNSNVKNEGARTKEQKLTLHGKQKNTHTVTNAQSGITLSLLTSLLYNYNWTGQHFQSNHIQARLKQNYETSKEGKTVFKTVKSLQTDIVELDVETLIFYLLFGLLEKNHIILLINIPLHKVNIIILVFTLKLFTSFWLNFCFLTVSKLTATTFFRRKKTNLYLMKGKNVGSLIFLLSV